MTVRKKVLCKLLPIILFTVYCPGLSQLRYALQPRFLIRQVTDGVGSGKITSIFETNRQFRHYLVLTEQNKYHKR
jgi:hypothetical protein